MLQNKNYYLSDTVKIISGGTPKTSVREYWDGDIPWLSVKDFNGDSKRVYESEKHITALGLNNSSTNLLQYKDVIISARGTVGELAQIGRQMAFNQSCYGLRANKNLMDSDYLYYLLKSEINQIKQSVHGSVFDTITRDTFRKIKVSLPLLPTQRRIAAILSSLDDKIENNRKTAEKLEEIAQVIFKRWFVDFEFPNKYGKPHKSSGGEMVYCDELGKEIPQGWNADYIGDVSKITAGGDKPDCSSKVKTDSCSVPIYSNGISNEGLYGYTDKARIFSESVTISARGTIGYTCLRTEPYFPIVRLICIEPNVEMLSSKYMYLWLKNSYIRGAGTTQQQLTAPMIKKYYVLVPSFDIINKFTSVVSPMFEYINQIKYNNGQLVKVRDALLPKLMSGEIKVENDL